MSLASRAAASRRSVSTVLRLFPSNAKVEGEVLVDGENVFDHEVEPHEGGALG